MKPEIVKWAKGAGYGGQKRVPKGSRKGGQFAGKGGKKGNGTKERVSLFDLPEHKKWGAAAKRAPFPRKDKFGNLSWSATPK